MAASDKVQWRGDKALFRGTEISPSQFQSLAYGLIDRTWREMLQKLFLLGKDETADKVLPKISMDKLHDEPGNSDPGFWFLHDPRNKWPVNGKTWMQDRVLNSPKLREQFVQADSASETSTSDAAQSQPQWSSAKVEKYMRDVCQFKERLLILMHVAGGPPPRSEDILKLRYRNPTGGDHRNVFIESGMVVFATLFLKPVSQTGTRTPEVAPRYMPPEVSQMLVYYLWLILPFQEILLAKSEKPTSSSPYIWDSGMDKGKTWDKAHMEQVLQRETESGMGVKLDLRSYRKVAFAMMRKMVDTTSLFEDSEGED